MYCPSSLCNDYCFDTTPIINGEIMEYLFMNSVAIVIAELFTSMHIIVIKVLPNNILMLQHTIQPKETAYEAFHVMLGWNPTE